MQYSQYPNSNQYGDRFHDNSSGGLGGALSQAVSQSNTLNERLQQMNQESDTFPTSIPMNITHDQSQNHYGGSMSNVHAAISNQGFGGPVEGQSQLTQDRK